MTPLRPDLRNFPLMRECSRFVLPNFLPNFRGCSAKKQGSQELGASLEKEILRRPNSPPAQNKGAAKRPASVAYTVKELPQPQVLLTLGLLNLNPAPSSVSM